MVPILVAVVTVGVALAMLMAGLFAWLRQDMGGRIERLGNRTNERFEQMEARINERFEQMEARINERIGQLETRTNERLGRLDNRLAAVEHGQARLEGLLEGLREAISGRREAS